VDAQESVEAPVAKCTIEAELDTETGTISGNVRFDAERMPPGFGGRIPLYLYPNIYSVRDPNLNDVVFPLRFPGGFSAGGIEVTRVTVGGKEARLAPQEATAAPQEAREGVATLVLIESAAGGPVAADGEPLVVEIDFATRIPERYGTFGRTDEGVVLLSAWHPVLGRPEAAAPAGGSGEDTGHGGGTGPGSTAGVVPWGHGGGTGPGSTAGVVPWVAEVVEAKIAVDTGGLLVVGNLLRKTSAGVPQVFDEPCVNAALLYFRPEFETLDVKGKDGAVTGVVVTGAGTLSETNVGRLVEVVHEASGLLAESGCPTLLLEAPLRESLAVPFPGGILFSDMIFSVTPFKRFLQRHTEALTSALVASHLMTSRGQSRQDAMVAASLLELWRWQSKQTRPDFIKDLMRQGEVVGALDKIATDPQTHFEATVFFSPELPSDVARTFEVLATPAPPPLTTARLLAVAFGWKRCVGAVTEALETRRPFIPTLRSRLSTEEEGVLDAILAPRSTDLVLDELEESEAGATATVCKTGAAAPFPVELEVRDCDRVERKAVTCEAECCREELPGWNEDAYAEVDPEGLFEQAWLSARHPRRNDRNYLDLKWMLSRPFFSYSSEDSLPSAGFEIVAQPRYDLSDSAFIYPVLVPARAVLMAGWRGSFGARVRPNFLSDQLSVAVRVAAATEGGDQSVGPALVYVHHTRQSRNNPFEGSFLELHGVPIYTIEDGDLGGRAGMIAVQMLGKDPDHVVAVKVAGDATIGELPEWESPSTGGIVGVRALGSDEIRLRHWAGASIEYRSMLVRSWNTSLLGLAFLNGIQLAVFTDGATMGDRFDEFFTARHTFVDAGMGLRPHFQVLGFVPGMMSLDVAYLIPWPHDLDDRVVFSFALSQPF